MKKIILIFLLFPFLLTAGWVKHGNGYLSEDSLAGQKRFLPEENAIIVESKDYVLKFDLTTGEIVKRIDIVETDSTYKNAVANDDLSQVFLRKENFFRYNAGYNDYLYIRNIEDYYSGKSLLLDSIKVPLSADFQNLDRRTDLFFNRNKLFYSLYLGMTRYVGRTQNSYLDIFSINGKDTVEKINNREGYIDNYSYFSTHNDLCYIDNYSSDIRTKGLNYSKYLNELLSYDFENNKFFLKFRSEEYSTISNIVIGKTNNNLIYYFNGAFQHKNYDNQSHKTLKYGRGTTLSFTKNDSYFITCYQKLTPNSYENEFTVQTFDSEILFVDTIPLSVSTKLAFDDGMIFYFQKNDRLFKYEPDFLKSSNLKAIISDISDTLNFAEEFYVESHSSGSPNSFHWYLDNELISNESSVSHSIGILGNHQLKLVVKNEVLIDSISKSIYIREIKINDIKKIDYSINLLNSKPIRILFTVNQGYNFQKYYWNFGDGFTDTGEKVSHTYLDTGTYSVTLTGIREDGSFVQEIKNNLISNESIDPDYKSNLFQKFELRDDDMFYFKSTKTLFDVKVTVVDKNNVILFNEFYKVLSESEIKSIRKPLDNEYIIILENKNGDVYEY